MEIQQQEHGKRGAFFIDEDGEWIAELTYVIKDDKTIDIDHTEVAEDAQGEGLGRDLVAAAVEHARKNKLKIKATCPFAKKVFDETPEYKDVLV